MRKFMEQDPEAELPPKQEPVRSATAATSGTTALCALLMLIARKAGLEISAEEAIIVLSGLAVLVNLFTNEVARQKVFAPFKER
jgi:hypothetical protein